MVVSAPLFWFLTLISSLSVVASCVLAFSRWGSASTRRTRAPRSDEPTPTSGQLAQLQADQVELFSALEKITRSVNRLNSRAGMREKREHDQDERAEPPRGTPKAELLRHYGMSGKVGPDFARAQQQLEIDMNKQRSN